jgi:hypothetical protein
MTTDTYELNGIELNVAYQFTPAETGDYLQPSYKGYVEVLKVWLPSDQLKTNIMGLIPPFEIDVMEDLFFNYENDHYNEK